MELENKSSITSNHVSPNLLQISLFGNISVSRQDFPTIQKAKVMPQPRCSEFGSKIRVFFFKNKPAAQAEGADPSQCNSTNRQNQPFQ